MTFTTELFMLIESDADMYVNAVKIERLEEARETVKDTNSNLWRAITPNYGNWWYFKDQEVVVDYQGQCSARDINGYLVTLQFTITVHRPVERKDL